MRFQVGKFTAEFKLGDSGQLQVLWSPYRPCYLNRGEREQYRAARAAFLESLKPGHGAASPPSPGEASAKDCRTSGLAIAVLLMAMAFARDVQAAPFCAVYAYGTQCFYYTMDSCRMAAGSSGACIINQNEVRPPMGMSNAPFCVVAPYGTQCFYYDAASCQQAAAMSGGACAVNPNR
jgi:hypothetical protein